MLHIRIISLCLFDPVHENPRTQLPMLAKLTSPALW